MDNLDKMESRENRDPKENLEILVDQVSG